MGPGSSHTEPAPDHAKRSSGKMMSDLWEVKSGSVHIRAGAGNQKSSLVRATSLCAFSWVKFNR